MQHRKAIDKLSNERAVILELKVNSKDHHAVRHYHISDCD